MEAPNGEGPDSSSIKPVSSLRSKFENVGTSGPQKPLVSPANVLPAKDDLSAVRATIAQKKPPPAPPAARKPLDLAPRSAALATHQDLAAERNTIPASPPHLARSRPQSMLVQSPPRLAVTAPTSPPKSSSSKLDTSPNEHVLGTEALTARPGRPQVPLARHLRLASRSASRSAEALLPLGPTGSKEPSQGREPDHNASNSQPVKPAPLVNRAAKSGPLQLGQLARSATSPPMLHSPFEQPSKSPFSSSPEEETDGFFRPPPPVPTSSKPSFGNDSLGDVGKSTGMASYSSSPHPPRTSSSTLPTPAHVRRRSRSTIVEGVDDEPKYRPVLPPRSIPSEPLIRNHVHGVRSAGSRGSIDAGSRPSALTQGFSRQESLAPTKSRQHNATPAPTGPSTSVRSLSRTPPPRPSGEVPRSYKSETRIRQPVSEAGPPSQPQVQLSTATNAVSEYPDSSFANRRGPYFRRGPRMISTTYDSRLFDIRGEFVCTSGSHTRVWSLLTGKLLLSMAHGEQIRTNAIAFKPTRAIEDEGKLIWIGNNVGEVQEVDVTTKRIISFNETAHARRELVKIYRNGTDMWTLDNEGKVVVWPSGSDGSPSLNHGIPNGRVPQGHSTSVVAGGKLWLACGRNLHVFQPSTDPSLTPFKVTTQVLQTPGASDFISSAVVRSQPDKVFFGHIDGKISVFRRDDYCHIETLSVSLHKVTCLVGVGSQLWAGFNSGAIATYDASKRPLKTLKQWKSHSQAVLNLISDEASLWKLGRWHVVSLGADNMIAIWDGMLEEDWLEDYMRSMQPDFSSHEKLSAAVFTWNAGASKPTDLRYDHGAADFFRDFLKGGELPDIMVFGLQELVDLEDKKLTAKSLFRSKKQDSYGHEHLGSVYRAWRDYLARCLDEYLPDTGGYAELHASSLVGLFTCVFVKAGIRHRIRDLQAAQVKTGMGGLHGNKGALIVRFLFEDTSMCFTNCHLAAGQTSTTQRNNDIAAILEGSHLPPGRKGDHTSYICGGDGSMVMDHEICILNGDLNYRIDTMSRDTVVNAIRNQNLAKLLERDQLLLSRRKFPGFRLRDFTEQAIKFRPTYKYDVGSDEYDTSEKRRSPAWCDRILHRSLGEMKQLDYKRHEIRVSDHRPVTATFELRVKMVDAARREDCQARADNKFAAHQSATADEARIEYLSGMFGLSREEARQQIRRR